ncbi:MAG: GntR family transcriptional regulator [Bacteroidota bacterium]|nr:GntR family transcriptional regulator [Bacteroidota bacterium]
MVSHRTKEKTISKKEKVYQELKLEIISQRLKGGQPITEDEVVRKYFISRTPVREIFRKLEMEGLLQNIPYKGAYVTNITAKDIEDILDIRFALESFAAKLAAARATDADIKKFEEMETQFVKAMKTRNSGLSFETDTKLHDLILRIAGNKRIHSIITNLLTQIHRIRYISGHVEGRMDTTTKEHLEIIKAIKKRDAILAEEKMQMHISNTKELLLKPSKSEEEFLSLLSSSNNT